MKNIFLAAFLTLNVMLAGCGVGDAPMGMSKEDAKSQIDKMSPQEKIKFIASSPLSGEEKQKRFAEIEKETGVKASDVLGGNMGSPGASTTPK